MKSRKVQAACLVMIGVLAGYFYYRHQHATTVCLVCEQGISNVRRGSAATVSNSPAVQRVPDSSGNVPADKVKIPGGEFAMGSDEPEFKDARPWHRVYVSPFLMDRTAVTNEQFAAFVKATHYVTLAEIAPTAKEFPTAAPENLVAGSVVFSPPTQPVSLNNHL